MRNAGLDEIQTKIKIIGRNINNLKYADDATPNGRKGRGTKEPFDERERGEWKIGLKLNIQKTKIMASGPLTSWWRDGGGEWKQWQILFSWAPKSLQMVTAAAVAAKSRQSYLTLCDPIDGSPLGSPIPGILQARTLEWVAISFSNAWKWKVKVKSLSRVWILATPWTAAYQAPPSTGFF